MKRILILLFSVLFIFSCSKTVYNINGNDTQIFGVSQKNLFEKNFSYEQFDSICRADKISNNLNKKWHKIKLFNTDNRQTLYQYLYIKTDNNSQTIYRVQNTQYEDSLKITKRVEK